MRVRDLGRLGYRPAWDAQLVCWEEVRAGGPDTLLVVEHHPVLTLGAGFHDENLLLSLAEYEARGIEVVRTDRGGDVTYHGPGQLVVYPIVNLERQGKDVHAYLRRLEEAVIAALGSGFGLAARRFPPHTGVWLGDEKVCAIGVKVRRWVTMHGLALNCDLDLAPFGLIVPCGIEGYGVTSLSLACGRRVGVDEARELVVESLEGELG